MQQLPKGYYAVQSDFANAPKTEFTFRGVTYAVTEGVNLFGAIIEANEKATEVPEVVLEGLPYEAFEAPVLLFSAGEHDIDRYKFTHSVVFLGEGAGINPNLPAENPLDRPPLNPARAEGESLLYGGYDFGNMICQEPSVALILVDGFTFRDARFRDLRNDGCHTRITFRNIIELGPTGKQLFLASTPKTHGTLYREMTLQNIRLTDFDDYDYAGMFAQVSAHKMTVEGICYDNTTQLFGFTTIPRGVASHGYNQPLAEYTIRNSYFANMKGENGISTGCRTLGDRKVILTVEGCTFVNACRENEGVLQPHLANDDCELIVKDCTFVDNRGNSGAAITPFGPGRNITIENSTFEGYATEMEGLPIPPSDAPLYIENHEENWTTETADPHTVIGTKHQNFSEMNARYAGTTVRYGDLHTHTNSGGTSDGKTPMAEWPAKMDENGIDFAVIVDHRQMRGFFLPEWDEERFVIGNEPGTWFDEGLNACYGLNVIHYNMIFPHKYGLAMTLLNFPEFFQFKGDELTGFFQYNGTTKDKLIEIAEYIRSIGGIFVHAHPKVLLCSHDPLDFYFGEHTYIEVIYHGYTSHGTVRGHKLWCDLLAMGKRVYASGGSDTHNAVSDMPYGVCYTKEKLGRAYFDKMHEADFAVGGAGMQMCIDGHPMGSEIEYKEGMKLTLRTGDMFRKLLKENTAYELRIFTDKGLAYSSMYNGKETQEIELAVEKRAFYRAEIYDLTNGYWVAVGNPIWLD
ncbi:MAG: hypothetical protein IKD28_03540 [Clostridia bacterium]|nr:hypothetical protein [Clostridia bacterium]